MDRYDKTYWDTFTWDSGRKIFLSVEPLLDEIELTAYPDWLIIGAETGNRKGRVIPRQVWIDNIVDDCEITGMPVWMKDNLKDIYRGDLIQERPEVGV